MLLCIIRFSISWGDYVIALMLLCSSVWFLDVIEPLVLALLLLCQFCDALLLLCIGCRTFSVGTDVTMPMYGCTDVNVQDVCFGS